MTLAATDTGGSNLKNTEYRVDGGTFAVYSAPIVVSADGTHTIEYRSTDNDGNVEATKSLTVKKDAVTPETTASLFPAAPGAGGTYRDPVTLTLTGADATSGVAKIEYQVNQASPFGAFGAPKIQNAALAYVTYDPANKPVFSAPGNYSIDYRSTDAAGNVETAKSIAFSITIRHRGAGHHGHARSRTARPRPDVRGSRQRQPVGERSRSRGPAGPDVQQRRLRQLLGAEHVQPHRRGQDHVELPRGQSGQPHDVWVITPGGNPAPNSPDNTQVTSGIVFPGGPSVSKTFTQTGTWTFYCSLHSSFSGGRVERHGGHRRGGAQHGRRAAPPASTSPSTA